MNEAEIIANNILMKLNKEIDAFDVKAKERNINEKDLSVEYNSGYTFCFKSKNYLGSFVYVDLFCDGNLMGVQVHEEKLMILI